NHLLKYKGTTLYPPAIYDVLDNTSYVDNYVVEVSLDENGNDNVLVRAGAKRLLQFQSEIDIIKDLKDKFRAKIRVAPEIEICSTDEIRKTNFPDISRKPVKFIDKRHSKK
ncbi:MAG: phenylacetate--CoA ligase family protein, partial [Dysgonamonadaceae bacterium]|nr:phenylacetate--CoA ligase family protein [Dysgonamonadaceae bacterium]